jgi:hypothetical protein
LKQEKSELAKQNEELSTSNLYLRSSQYPLASIDLEKENLLLKSTISELEKQNLSKTNLNKLLNGKVEAEKTKLALLRTRAQLKLVQKWNSQVIINEELSAIRTAFTSLIEDNSELHRKIIDLKSNVGLADFSEIQTDSENYENYEKFKNYQDQIHVAQKGYQELSDEIRSICGSVGIDLQISLIDRVRALKDHLHQ